MKIDDEYNDLDEEVKSGDEVDPLEGVPTKQDGEEGGSISELTYNSMVTPPAPVLQTSQRSSELALELNCMAEKLEVETKRRAALENLVKEMQESWRKQKDLFVEKVKDL